MVEKQTKIYETKDLHWELKRNIVANILKDFGYNWRTIGQVSFDYEIEENHAKVYIDFRKMFIIEMNQNKETEQYLVTYYNLGSMEELEQYIKELPLSEFDKTLQRFKIYKESLKGESKKKIVRKNLEIKEGDLLNSNWGYDQTNVEFFKVKRVLGKNYIIIQEVGRKYDETGFMCGDTKATNNELNKLPKKAFIDSGGFISVCETGYKRGLWQTDLKETHYTSSYA